MSTDAQTRRKQAQTWSVDYIIAITLFFAAIILSLKIIINQFPDNSFERLNQDAFTASEMLISTGYPESWDNTSVVQLGLTTGHALNLTKLRYLYRMDFTAARSKLKTRYNYYLTFADKDRGIMFMNQTCGYGSTDVRNNGSVSYDGVAYYYQQEGGDHLMLLPLWNSYEADVYFRDRDPGEIINGVRINGSLDRLLANLSRYNLVLLEDPHFDSFTGSYTEQALKERLEGWVSKGNTLILTEQVSLDPFLHVSFPDTPLGSGNSTIINEQEDVFFQAGDGMVFTDKFTLTPTGDTRNFVKVSNYSNAETGIATWTFGEGAVVYYPDISAIFGGTQVDITPQVNRSVQKNARGFCDGLDLSLLSYRNMASIDRYIIFNDRLVDMRLTLWDNT